MKTINKQILKISIILLISQNAVAQFDASINLADLNGSNGVTINGIGQDDRSGVSVSYAGDVNGDGIDDVIIGAWGADPNGNTNSGSSYVVFGNSGGFTSTLELSSLDGSNGFIINGVAENDLSGAEVSYAGDVNGDGIDDVIIGAQEADPNGSNSGSIYVVFGNNGGFTPTVELSSLDGSNGFIINGVAEEDLSGWSVSYAGDVNGDGIEDVIIGAWLADPDNNSNAGSSYVVFGNNVGFTPIVELSTLNGSNGFVINGTMAGDVSGYAVSYAGDVNGDGIDDVMIGTPGASPDDLFTGSTHVVFGNSKGFPSSFNLSTLNGNNGFAINGVAANDGSGTSVSYAGDINGDGVDDVIIGAEDSDVNGTASGSSYVVFGSDEGFAPTLELSSLDGTNGFSIYGEQQSDRSGVSVSNAGDVNDDGIDDVIIGARYASPNGIFRAGRSYVVFGSNEGFASTVELSSLNGNNGFILNGEVKLDVSGFSVSQAGDFNGDGVDDIIIGALGVDIQGNSRVGSSYVVFGKQQTIFKNGFE